MFGLYLHCLQNIICFYIEYFADRREFFKLCRITGGFVSYIIKIYYTKSKNKFRPEYYFYSISSLQRLGSISLICDKKSAHQQKQNAAIPFTKVALFIGVRIVYFKMVIFLSQLFSSSLIEFPFFRHR